MYPTHSSVVEIKAYLALTAKYNFTHDDKEKIVSEFTETINSAHELDVSYDDLTFFKESGIRQFPNGY